MRGPCLYPHFLLHLANSKINGVLVIVWISIIFYLAPWNIVNKAQSRCVTLSACPSGDVHTVSRSRLGDWSTKRSSPVSRSFASCIRGDMHHAALFFHRPDIYALLDACCHLKLGRWIIAFTSRSNEYWCACACVCGSGAKS